MSEEMKSHLKDMDTWKRLLFMLLFVVIYNVAEILIAVVVLFQVIATLFTGSRNRRVLEFGAQLSTYIYEILQYLTYNSDEVPFPFAEWPKAGTTVEGTKPSAGAAATEAIKPLPPGEEDT